MNVRLRYFIRVTITRSYNTVVKEQDFAVQNYIAVGVLMYFVCFNYYIIIFNIYIYILYYYIIYI